MCESSLTQVIQMNIFKDFMLPCFSLLASSFIIFKEGPCYRQKVEFKSEYCLKVFLDSDYKSGDQFNADSPVLFHIHVYSLSLLCGYFKKSFQPYTKLVTGEIFFMHTFSIQSPLKGMFSSGGEGTSGENYFQQVGGTLL